MFMKSSIEMRSVPVAATSFDAAGAALVPATKAGAGGVVESSGVVT
jgi:hypothetical protein